MSFDIIEDGFLKKDFIKYPNTSDYNSVQIYNKSYENKISSIKIAKQKDKNRNRSHNDIIKYDRYRNDMTSGNTDKNKIPQIKSNVGLKHDNILKIDRNSETSSENVDDKAEHNNSISQKDKIIPIFLCDLSGIIFSTKIIQKIRLS